MSAISAETLTPGADAPAQLFVINLCASTSPMALSHPSAPELKRYTFFVSRQREDGRERFRLHMGYFPTQEEAEKLLEAVRDVYPAAWAGLAPTSGGPRRGRAGMPSVTPVPLPVQLVPVAALPLPAVSLPEPEPAPAPTPAAPAVQLVAAAVVAELAPQENLLESMSNVRDVLAQLSEAPAAKPAPKPVAAVPAAELPRLQPAARVAEPPLSDLQTLQVLETPPPVAIVAAPAPVAAPPNDVIEEPEVRVVTPEDTQTLTDIRIDAQNNAPPCFAVQLMWSVAPIDVASLPHLAIFDAYTLYNVEGNRQGRKWFGLRLGFFSDPNSATQVANYVRSDYRAVAIVPVAIKERDRAGGTTVGDRKKASPRLGEAAAPLKPEPALALNTENLNGFELLADDRPAAAKRDFDDRPAAAAGKPVPKLSPKAAAPVARPVPAAAAKPAAGKPTGKRVMVRKRPDAPLSRTAPGATVPLESTLEILGASTLTLDESREIINDSAVRKPVARKPPTSGNRFSKLLSRLGGN